MKSMIINSNWPSILFW